MDGKSNFTIKVLSSSFCNYFRNIYRINTETDYRNYLEIVISQRNVYLSALVHFIYMVTTFLSD